MKNFIAALENYYSLTCHSVQVKTWVCLIIINCFKQNASRQLGKINKNESDFESFYAGTQVIITSLNYLHADSIIVSWPAGSVSYLFHYCFLVMFTNTKFHCKCFHGQEGIKLYSLLMSTVFSPPLFFFLFKAYCLPHPCCDPHNVFKEGSLNFS